MAITRCKRDRSIPVRCDCNVRQTDVDAFMEILTGMWSKLGHDDKPLNAEVLREFASSAAGQLCPLQAIIGGIAAQEVLKVGRL